jgi:hypothetical protein
METCGDAEQGDKRRRRRYRWRVYEETEGHVEYYAYL